MRDSELTRASAVLSCQRAGDTQGMIEAAARFWLEPAERPDVPDDVARDVWRVIVEAAAIEPAAKMGLRLFRDGKLLRPAAFIDVSENLGKDELVELAEIVLARGWATYPYLAAVFMRLVEKKETAALWQLIQQHRQTLYAASESWLLVALVMSTSQVGMRTDLDAWMEGHEHREGVPMWMVAAYAGVISQEAGLTVAKVPNLVLARLAALARQACETRDWDESAAYFVYLMLIDDLRQGRDAEFLAGMAQHRELLARAASTALLDHPIVRYANGVKHVHAVTQADLDFRRYLGTVFTMVGGLQAVADADRPRPINLQLAELVADFGDLIEIAGRILALFPVMHALAPGDPKAEEMMTTMLKARVSQLPQVKPAWQRFIKARVSWVRRVRFVLTS